MMRPGGICPDCDHRKSEKNCLCYCHGMEPEEEVVTETEQVISDEFPEEEEIVTE